MLVERIINKIINENVDIDRLLIVTFTNAAASEMRQRILEALYKKIDENPNNENLRRQIFLLNKANISTIHAFCLEVIKNYFYEIGISSNFRIGDTGEVELLKQESLEETFEELYEEKNKEFINLVNIYSGYRDDNTLKELILRIYNYSQSMPFPLNWINENVEKFNLNLEQNLDFAKITWGNILVEYFKEELQSSIKELENLANKLKLNSELIKYHSTILNDIDSLKEIENSKNWDEIYNNLLNLKFVTWPRETKTDCELKDIAKEKRDCIKDSIKVFSKKIFIYTSKEAIEDIYSMYNILKSIQNVIIKFNNKFVQNKKDKNIIDFGDIEHFALKILLKEENGNYIPTEIAKIYQQKFHEIAIDEYQDSNLVQEYILKSISKNNNIFMVGDVKQSIYKFRGARPELFLEKYNSYILAEDNNKECTKNTKIQLFQNFRSRKNILDFTNIVFQSIMSKKLGDVEYNEEEFLNASANFEDSNKNVGGKIELDIIDLKEQYDEEETENEILQKNEIEAKFVANRINKLLTEDYFIFDKKVGYRKLTYKDIVILLRTTSNIANLYEKELNKLEIPVFSDTSSNYFETEEIQTVLSILKIIDNPNNDIPLVTVLRSQIGGFTDNELIEIRLNSKNTNFYNALLDMSNIQENTMLKQKVAAFLNNLEKWQTKQEYLRLDELIWYLYETTGFYDYTLTTTNGELKVANLKLLFQKAKDYEMASFKGLYNFINYIDKIKNSGGDGISAKLIGENENVVRIMSIHKSKGLEFPVVFLSGTGKQFNLQDLNDSILLHQDIGFGPKVIDYERKIEYNTLAKEAIRIKMLNETLSEEMRLLYVALTRAKEKLIITGFDKNLEKSIASKESMTLGISNIRKAKSYLEWLELVYLKDNKNLEEILEINYYNKNEVNNKQEEKEENTYNQNLNNFLKNIKKEDIEKVNKLLSWKYRYEESTKIQGKTAATKITHKQDNKLIEAIKEPKFLEKAKKITSSEIGTLMHLIMQKLDFKKECTKGNIQELIQELIAKNIITVNEANYIKLNEIIEFGKSKLYKELQTAKQVKKEQPFYIYLDSKEIYGTKESEKILVQGIIDLYYINKNDELVLVDYKTDYVQSEQELIDKYKEQLELYKTALEKALGKKVSKTLIYSLYLNKEINCKLFE